MRQLNQSEKKQISGGLSGGELALSTFAFALFGAGIDVLFVKESDTPYFYTYAGALAGFVLPFVDQL